MMWHDMTMVESKKTETSDKCNRYLFSSVQALFTIAYFHRTTWWETGCLLCSIACVARVTSTKHYAACISYPFQPWQWIQWVFPAFSSRCFSRSPWQKCYSWKHTMIQSTPWLRKRNQMRRIKKAQGKKDRCKLVRITAADFPQKFQAEEEVASGWLGTPPWWPLTPIRDSRDTMAAGCVGGGTPAIASGCQSSWL